LTDVPFELDERHMRRAIELARRGEGSVEPNPMVGCVVARGETVVAEGWHQKFGGPHAEIEALNQCQGQSLADCTLYVTLEPCCHQGKTPPCTKTILQSGIGRVVVAQRDPFPKVDGGGLKIMIERRLDVHVGLLSEEAADLNAPYLKLQTRKRPWIIAKWAMSLDGKIATRSGHSQWISSEASRQIVHQLRGRVDAIMVGRATAERDNPKLTARPAGPRVATRIVVDSQARLSLNSHLVKTAREIPVIAACGPEAPREALKRLTSAGVEVVCFTAATPHERLLMLLDELGTRNVTNVLVEGGGQLLGELFDAREIDEAHTFICPKLIGGEAATTPIAGQGLALVPQSPNIRWREPQLVDGDVYLTGRVAR
jgi:diaminohydroxyphosphoribosylaminopyrimidine deaminase/5-amino-6-(5-phosphoribosylamino)uracil reductase